MIQCYKCCISYKMLSSSTEQPVDIALTNRIMKNIKRKIKNEIKEGYGGIDIALDSEEFCTHNQTNMFHMINILKEEYPSLEYSYDEYGDSHGACCHHISIIF